MKISTAAAARRPGSAPAVMNGHAAKPTADEVPEAPSAIGRRRDKPPVARAQVAPAEPQVAVDAAIDRLCAAADAEKPTVVVDVDEHRVADEVQEALLDDPTIFTRGGSLVTVTREPARVVGMTRPAGSVRIVTLGCAGLRDRITDCVKLVREDAEGKLVPIHPPGWLPQAIEARGEYPAFARLEGIVEAPSLRPDGTILDEPGYDLATALLYEPSIEFPKVADRPTRDDARRAAELVLDVVADFPFAAPSHRAAWLAGCVLTPLARSGFVGPAPLTAIDKNVRGAGGSLLADVGGMIATGRPLARMSNPDDDAEARKKITSVAMLGERVVLIDNVEGVLGGSAFNAALTAVDWTDRRLGSNAMVKVPLVTTWVATGNNLVLNGDTIRRTLHVRLESPLERPEERDDVRHPRLLDYVRQHRGELVTAALTMLRAHAVAGRPNHGLKPWGSFEEWSDVVRGAVVYAGLPDPGETRRQLATAADREAGALAVLLEELVRLDDDRTGITSVALVEYADLRNAHGGHVHVELANAIAELCPGSPGRAVSARSLGSRLAHLRGRVVGGRSLDSVASRLGAAWRVAEVSQ